MTAPSRRTLGAHLARLVTLSTALGLAVFTAVAALVVWVDEVYETDDAGDADRDEDADDGPLDEVVEDLGLAVLIATPLGLVVALAGARWAARQVTGRIDALVATASRMTAEDLRERLPVSSRGDELDDLITALNGLFTRIDDGIAALRRFAADTSHELRTPLAVTINALEVARRRPRERAEWERVSDQTLEELRRMAELVEALLQGARAGAFDLATEPVEIDFELPAIADRWRDPARAAGVALAVDAGSEALARVDPRGLAIAIGNLVGNAIAHSPRGGTVTLRSRRRDDRIVVEVDDQGPGVPAADRTRIFAPFVRGEAAYPAGIGLGLAIARRIVEAHGGTLEVGDAPGGGARFALELPAA
jgi:signal transduction histidine kinase